MTVPVPAEPVVVERSLELPADACAGHFPGQPLVPGVLQLVLVTEALVEARPAPGLTLGRVRRVRFRRPLAPDADLWVSARCAELEARFRLLADGEVVADGSVALASLPDLETSPDLPPAPALARPSASASLPYGHPMLLVEGVVSLDEEGGACWGRVGAGSQLVRAGRVPAVAVVELAAQSLALLDAARRRDAGSPARGYLVGVSNAILGVKSMAVGAPLLAAVERTAWAPPLAQARARVTLAGREVLRCTLQTWRLDPRP